MTAGVQHVLSPGRLVISVAGIESARSLEDLDVKEDCVTFLANGKRVRLPLAAGTINTSDCSARFRKKDLIISWAEPVDDAQEGSKQLETGYGAADQNETLPTPLRESSQAVKFRLGLAVKWALQKLELLEIPECSGFQRFKAEVGLAELAFYGLRICRLGTPNAVWRQVQEAENGLAEALQHRAAGEEPSEVFTTVRKVLKRVAGAVSDRSFELEDPPLLGHPSQVGTGAVTLVAHRWTLRSGRSLGPGIGTWKLSPEEAEKTVAAALNEGVRHVDTAAEYGTEEAVARGIRSAGVSRDDVFVNLKVAAESDEELRKVIDASMEKWGHESVDCLMLHRAPENDKTLEKLWAVLEDEVKRGRAKMLGASNITASQLQVLTSHRDESLWPAVVQLKCSIFHQGGYFIDNPSALWKTLQTQGIVPVGISLFNPLHSCVSPLEEPLCNAWAQDLACSPAELLAHWACAMGVCPLLRCSPRHASCFSSTVHLPRPMVAALTSLSNLTETSFCPSMRELLDLRSRSQRRSVKRGDHLTGQQVEVHSLKSADGQKLNGKLGLLMDFEEDTGRWQVALPEGVRKIRPEHLSTVLVPLQDDLDPAERSGRFLKDLFAAGNAEAMMSLLRQRKDEVDWALLETVSANLSFAESKGYGVKQQVLGRLLNEVKQVLASREPIPRTVLLPPPSLDATASWQGSSQEAEKLLTAVSAVLDSQGFAICDNFASAVAVQDLADELASYDRDFETAKIWVGKQASGAQLSVPTVRSDRILWVCGEHRTPAREMLWDSAGEQPSEGLAPCRPEVVMEKSTAGFPELRKIMNRVDDFVLKGLAKHVPRLAHLAERSDAMISIYEDGARFQKHVDNPNRDGRILTSIVYLNYGEAWGEDDGGQLRMFLEGEAPIDLTPDTGRLVLFWANEIPHEVLPSKRRRMALTYWWFDRSEREAKVKELAKEMGNTQLRTKEERLAQEFIAYMLSEGSKPEDIIQRAKKLPSKSLSTVAAVVGATSNAEALEGIERLSSSDLERLRGSMGKMGLN